MNPCRQMQAAIGPETDETTSDMIIQAYFKSDNAPLMSLLGISLFCTPDSSLPPQPLLSPPRKMLSAFGPSTCIRILRRLLSSYVQLYEAIVERAAESISEAALLVLSCAPVAVNYFIAATVARFSQARSFTGAMSEEELLMVM